MQNDKRREPTREEVVARWRRRQEQDQRYSQEQEEERSKMLESELWKVSSLVKKHDPRYLEIAPSLSESLKTFLGGPPGWDNLTLVGDKVVLDKLAQSMTVRKLRFPFIRTKHDIPFSAVRSVVTDYERYTSVGARSATYYDVWRISLIVSGEKAGKVELCRGTYEHEMYDLAIGISKFMGRELIHNTEKPDDVVFGTREFREGGIPPDLHL